MDTPLSTSDYVVVVNILEMNTAMKSEYCSGFSLEKNNSDIKVFCLSRKITYVP